MTVDGMPLAFDSVSGHRKRDTLETHLVMCNSTPSLMVPFPRVFVFGE